MSRDFTPLSFRTLEGSIPFFRPTQALPMRVDMDSPAVDVSHPLTCAGLASGYQLSSSAAAPDAKGAAADVSPKLVSEYASAL